jgi:hypothetical protein
MQQHLSQQKFQKTGLSVQAPISSDNDTVVTVVQRIMSELDEALSEDEKLMVITKMVVHLIK